MAMSIEAQKKRIARYEAKAAEVAEVAALKEVANKPNVRLALVCHDPGSSAPVFLTQDLSAGLLALVKDHVDECERELDVMRQKIENSVAGKRGGDDEEDE